MSEITLERLTDIEVASVDENLATAEEVKAVEAAAEAESPLSQRAIGCAAILCAGCPLVNFCPSARSAEVETPVTHDLGDFDITLVSAEEEIIVTDETQAVDSAPETKSEIAQPVVVEQEAPEPRSYLRELLDDSVEVVVAQNLRQPIVNEVHIDELPVEEPVAVTIVDEAAPVEVLTPVKPSPVEVVAEIKLEAVHEEFEADPVTDAKEPAIQTNLKELALSDDIVEPQQLQPEPQLEPEVVLAPEPEVSEEYVTAAPKVSLTELVVETVVDDETPEDVLITIQNSEAQSDVIKVVEFGEDEQAAEAAESEPVDDYVFEDNELDAELGIESTVRSVEELIDQEAVIADEEKPEVAADFSEEFIFKWYGYGDDLDEEHMLVKDDLTGLPIASRLNHILLKFLGKHACYALSSSS